MKKALTVDDSRAVRMTVKKALTGLDISIVEAGNGRAGFEAIKAEHPDLVILDYNMPEMTGEEVLEAVRDTPGVKETPIIVLTTESMADTVARLEGRGLAGYVTKPFRGPDLLAKVRSFMEL